MKSALFVAIGGVAIIVGGLTGCSGDKSAEESISSATETIESGASSATSAITSATEAAKGNPPPGAATVTIDGQEQNIEGQAVCTNMAGNIQIAIGNATQGIGAQVTEADPPVVKQVGLGNVNGVALGYTEGVPGGEASAEKDGNTYKISGNATGVDMANPMQPMTKSFELAVTCP
ncbi:MAG: lipoprotein LpqH [Mycobacterium sp.]